MPCPDQASLLKLKIAGDESILDYTYAKYSCGKPVGLGSGVKELILGLPARSVLDLTPQEAVRKLRLESEDDRFLLVVELEALTAAVAGYYGLKADVTPRYSIIGVRQEDGFVEIHQEAGPVPGAPEIPLPCSAYDVPKS
ncbi:hypothetical protein HY522_03600 [bacterium]|nr:hypothetical protein [bacterium]